MNWKRVMTLASFTFSSLLRERVLYNVLLVGVLLLFVGYIAALLVWGYQDRVMLSMGSMTVACTLSFLCASAGARVLRAEVESRALYLILSRSVTRFQVYLSRLLAIGFFSFLNLVLLVLMLWAAVLFVGGQWNFVWMQSFTLIWIEGLILLSFSQWLSLFFRPAITLMLCVLFYFVSHNHEQFRLLNLDAESKSLLFSVLQWVTPKAHVFLTDYRMFYNEPLETLVWIKRVVYGLSWSILFLSFGHMSFSRKQL